MATYWQIASGASGRDFSEEFIKYGLAFVGGNTNIETMKQVKPDDRIILKLGMSAIKAVGVVVERDGKHRGQDDKEWLRDFDGWDLRAYCKVRWHVPSQPKRVKGLTRATIQRVRKQQLQALAEKLLEQSPQKSRSPEPKPVRELSDREILEFLIKGGFSPNAAEGLTSAFVRIRHLAKYYYEECEWSDIREHETRTFLITPLLLALGWAEQQIKIELNTPDRGRIDIACFSRPYQRNEDGLPNNNDCVLIIESKGLNSGLDFAPEQAKSYARHFPSCEVVAVSNGYCYKTYIRNKQGSFSSAPTAYLNLLKPRASYPLDPRNVGGGLEVLRSILPRHWR